MRVPSLQRRHVAVLAVAAMVLFAGCAAFDTGQESSGDTTATTSSESTTTETTTETTETTTPESTTAETATTTQSDDSAADDGGPSDADLSGTMTVLVGGSQVELQGADGPVTFRDADRQWYTNEENVTIAAALAAQGVELTASSLTHEGTTYDESNAGTAVDVRVNGNVVDPTEYTLQDGDSVWIYVDSDDLDIEPPGEYIKQANDHQHGTIEVRVDGDPLDLTLDKYQHEHRHFHLEGGNGDTWHAHTWQATLGWALSTLDIEVSSDSVTIDGTTYDASDSNTTVQVTVNGEQLEDPRDYRLKDGDQIAIVVERSD